MKLLLGVISISTAVLIAVAVSIERKVSKIMATQAELAQALHTTSDQLDKAKTEILQRVQELTDAVNNSGQTTPEVDAALERLRTSTQGLDDVVPDVQNV